jgi:hypothetical protein
MSTRQLFFFGFQIQQTPKQQSSPTRPLIRKPSSERQASGGSSNITRRAGVTIDIQDADH